MMATRKFRMLPEMSEAEIVLRVPFYDRETYYRMGPEFRDVAVPLRDFIRQVLDNVDGDAFGREDSISLRLGSSSRFYFDGVPNDIVIERDPDKDEAA